MHPLLIPISLLTHTWDSMVYEKSHLTPMTYLDLLTTLENFSEDDLLLPVKCYDEDCEEFVPVFRLESEPCDDPYLVI